MYVWINIKWFGVVSYGYDMMVGGGDDESHVYIYVCQKVYVHTAQEKGHNGNFFWHF